MPSPKSRSALIVLAVLAAFGIGVATRFVDAQAQNPPPTSESLRHANALSQAFRDATNEVLPAVVMIRTEPVEIRRDTNRREIPPGFEDFFDGPFGGNDLRRFFRDMPEIPRHRGGGTGSGVIIDDSGIILTNNHVVAGGGKITVRLHDGREFEGVEMAADEKTDIAIVRIKGADGLHAAQLGDSDQVQVGDWVLALGQPFGLAGSVTAGIISAKGRGIGITDRENFLQTDAAVNPGNSGGPLVDLSGKVIGINTAISSRSGGYQGIAFAVPSNLASWVAKQLIDNGKVQRAQLGVAISIIDQERADKLGVKPLQGVVVEQVAKGAPADKAGVKVEDVILDYNGIAVHNPRELQNAVERSAIGQAAKMRIIRDGKRMTLNVAPQEASDRVALQFGQQEWQMEELGFAVRNLSARLAEQLGLKDTEGVVVTIVKRNSPAAQAGLEAGMVVTRVNKTAITDVAEFAAAVEKAPADEALLLNVKTADGSKFITVEPAE